jgi:hypothetical protein
MKRSLLALLLMACGTAPVAADDVVAAIDSCIHALDPSLDVGYGHVAERCPELARVLASSRYAAWLPPDWNRADNALSIGGLVELRRLLTAPHAPTAVRAPRVTQLAAVLSGLHQSDSAKLGWWARCKQWLRDLFAPQPEVEERSWLERLLANIDLSQSLTRAIVWGALLLVVLLSGGIVANELRVAGWWRARERAGSGLPAHGSSASSASTLAEVEHAAAAEQPHLLLQLIIERLRQQHRLPPARALTLSELERAARLRDQLDRERLAALTATCERARFAEDVTPASLAGAAARGRELLRSLATPPTRPPGPS